MNLAKALQVSSDVYFYKLGQSTFNHGGLLIQTWARKLGLDRPTGIDLPGEIRGTIPDPTWREEINDFELECRKREKIPRTRTSTSRAPTAAGARTCAATRRATTSTSRPARATCRRRRCRWRSRTRRSPTAARSSAAPRPGDREPRRRAHPAHRARRGAQGAHRPARPRRGPQRPAARGGHARGHVRRRLRGWDHARYPLFGKTGTAERKPKRDQSWYVAYVPGSAASDRRRGDGRGGRLRRRRRRADRLPDAREVVPAGRQRRAPPDRPWRDERAALAGSRSNIGLRLPFDPCSRSPRSA